MKMKMRKNILGLGIMFAIIFSMVFVFADTNGIWHRAEDVRGGVFGEDEQDVTSFYEFINPVTFNRMSFLLNRTGIMTTSPRAELEVRGRLFISDLGCEVTSGAGSEMFFDSENLRGEIQVYDFDEDEARNLVLQRRGGNVGIGEVNSNSRLFFLGDMGWSGSLVQGIVPWGRLSEHISVIAGVGLSGGGSLLETRTISLDLDYTDNRYVNRAGDTIIGDLNMGGNRIRGVASPINSDDVVTKAYVDTALDNSGTVLGHNSCYWTAIPCGDNGCDGYFRRTCPAGWYVAGIGNHRGGDWSRTGHIQMLCCSP